MSSATTTRVYQSTSTNLVVRPFSAAPRTDAEKAAQSAFIQTTLDTDKMAQLMAERKRINEMLKDEKATRKAEKAEAKANEPSKLDKAIARQAKSRVWIGSVIADMVQERAEAGQDRETALNEILAVYRDRANEALAARDAEAAAKADSSAQVVAPIAPVAPAMPTAAQAAPKTAKATKAAKASN